ncbi:MAG: hypothetical protein QF436_03680, partial [Candidatus Woesearchaeota archaeon]|jgi:hypothetical protein|nr:hypothetical protein [Candidatus Woesearchaeota archaeon]
VFNDGSTQAAGSLEGTSIKSTSETGGTKFLREDGDGSCSWQAADIIKGGDIASASPLVIDTDGSYFNVTGTAGFAAMTVAADRQFTLQFDGALTMTHHATNLDLPSEANITTAAGDVAVFQSTGANTVQCIAYTKADGTGVVSAGGNKTIFIPPLAEGGTSADSELSYGSVICADGSTLQVHGNWYVPDDFTSFTSLTCIVRPNGTGNIYADFLGGATSSGEYVNEDQDSIAVTTYAAQDSVTLFIDCTATANGLTFGANHVLGFEFNRQGGHANDTVNDTVEVYGWVFVYS